MTKEHFYAKRIFFIPRKKPVNHGLGRHCFKFVVFYEKTTKITDPAGR